MRVVSWNIQFGLAPATAAEELGNHPDLRDADILLLQEMDEVGTELIAGALGFEYVFNSTAPHANTGREFGNAVLSRWPLRDDAEILLPHVAPVNGQPRSATRAVVDAAGRSIVVYSVHTEVPTLRLVRRIEQFAAVTADVVEREELHVIVGGDFNTVTSRGVDALTAAMEAAGLGRLSSREPSYRGRGALLLDHIFGAGFRVVARGTAAGTEASDHDPIWAELRLLDEVADQP